MKNLLIATLMLLAPLSQAKAATWEGLTEKAMQEGTVLESNFGLTKHIERRLGSQVIYFTIELDSTSGEAKRYSAVVENWEKTPEGKYKVEQSLLWFTPLGELAVIARYSIGLNEDKSYESRKEIAYGESPEAADIDQWNAILAGW